jgi:hypothetical protein
MDGNCSSKMWLLIMSFLQPDHIHGAKLLDITIRKTYTHVYMAGGLLHVQLEDS